MSEGIRHSMEAAGRWSRILAGVGVALLGAMFVAAWWRAGGIRSGDHDERTVIRIAHWQLEKGIEEGFDAVARAYEKLHPNVRIVQLLVPERVYATWKTTQLVGGTAPDIIEVFANYQAERVAAHFHSIGGEIDAPNPYNIGSPAEGVPWRSTFRDGMASAYHEDLSDYFGVSLFTGARCMYFNVEVWRAIMGSDEAPTDFASMERAIERLAEFNRMREQPVLGFAVHRGSAVSVFNDLLAVQLQRISTELSPASGLPLKREEMLLAGLAGAWAIDGPEMRRALESMRMVSAWFPAGYVQLGREDALLSFAQGRALFYLGGTWDVGNLAAQVRFEVGIARFNLPTGEHPRFGAGILGPLASEENSMGPAFSVNRDSPHVEQAIDFLRFVTSYEGNLLFSRTSGWLPAVEGVPVPEGLAQVAELVPGYPRGPAILTSGEMEFSFARHLTALTSAQGGVDLFMKRFKPEAARAMRTDVERAIKGGLEGVVREDVAILAQLVLGGTEKAQAVAYRRAEAQNERESWTVYLATELGRVGDAAPHDQ